jgi:16S rRNA (guanine966-N2)-methyltransferase
MPRANQRRSKTPGQQQRAEVAATSGATALERSLSTRPGQPAPGRIRIVGGKWKRTPIAVADRTGLRPTPDRVRETLFNWLSFLRPDIATLRGLDLFAGTGVLGFELASRGARSVLLVERDLRLVGRLAALKERLDAKQIEILGGDSLTIAARLEPGTFDIVFLDPPFDSGLLLPALDRVRTLLAPQGLVYAESSVPIEPAQAAGLGLEVLRSGQAGRVRFHLLRKDAS